MELIDKLALLDLEEKEAKKVKEKFMATLSLISEDELKNVLSLLDEKGIKISKASEVKILANSKEEILKKFDILEEIHETDIYKEDPLRINKNVIDIYKKIKYCMQNGIEYKKEGEYNKALFNEQLWAELISEKHISYVNEEDLVTLEPAFEEEKIDVKEEKNEPDLISFDDILNKEKEMDEINTPSFEPLPEESYSMYEEEKVDNDLKEMDENATNFADIRKELEDQLKELDSIKTSQNEEINFDGNLSDIISFNDIEPESFGVGGRSV